MDKLRNKLQITSYKRDLWSSQKGFSIVEALVVAAIVGIMGVILTDLLSRTINGGNKTELLNNVKQNGQVTLNNMIDTMRQSTKVVCAGTIMASSANVITIIEKDGRYGRFHFYPPTAGTNGYIQHEFLVDYNNNSSPPDPTIDPTLFCSTLSWVNYGGGPTGYIEDPLSAPTTLTDTDPSTGISVSDCVFTWAPAPGAQDVVKVDMHIKAGVSAPTDYTSQVGDANGLEFTTSVQLQ